MGTVKPTAAEVRRLLDYDQETGVFRWKVATTNRVKVGQVAGSLSTTTGYLTITIAGKHFNASNLAGLHVTGEWPAKLVDHRNRNRTDNRFDNLRLASYSQNSANGPVHKDSKTGLRGVTLHKPGRWRAQIRVGADRIHLGLFDDPASAHAAYCAASTKHFGEFASTATTGGSHRKAI